LETVTESQNEIFQSKKGYSMFDDEYFRGLEGCIVMLVFLAIVVLILAVTGDAILNIK